MMEGFCFVISAMVINGEEDDDTKLRVLKISVLLWIDELENTILQDFFVILCITWRFLGVADLIAKPLYCLVPSVATVGIYMEQCYLLMLQCLSGT
jgi:hypothetical protein